MTEDTTINAPDMCEGCKKKLEATWQDTAWAFCPHNSSLALAELDERGIICGFVTFGPFTHAEAIQHIRSGLENAAHRYPARHEPAGKPH